MSDNNGDNRKPAAEEIKLNISLKDIQKATQPSSSDSPGLSKSAHNMMLDSPYGIFMSSNSSPQNAISPPNQNITQQPSNQQNSMGYQQQNYQQQNYNQPQQYYPQQYYQQAPQPGYQQNMGGYQQQRYAQPAAGYQPMQMQPSSAVHQSMPMQSSTSHPSMQAQPSPPVQQAAHPQAVSSPQSNQEIHQNHGHSNDESMSWHQQQPGQRFVPHYVPDHPHYHNNYGYTHYHPHPPHHPPPMYQQSYGGNPYGSAQFQQQFNNLEMGSTKERQTAIVKILDKDRSMINMDDKRDLSTWGTISGGSTFAALCAILFPFAIISMKNLEREVKVKYLKIGMGVQFLIGMTFVYSSYKVTQVLETIDRRYFGTYTLSELNNYLISKFNGSFHYPHNAGSAIAGMNRVPYGGAPSYYQQMQPPQNYGSYQAQSNENLQINKMENTEHNSKIE